MHELRTARLLLRPLTVDDVSDAYVAWLNDPLVTQFLESRDRVFTREDVRSYIAAMRATGRDHLFGMFLHPDGRHIGNIKIGSVNALHGFADLGLMIGDRSAWGQGYATEAIAAVTEHAFSGLCLNKLVAGIYENNVGSLRAFLKAGYERVGHLKRHRLCAGRYVDEILVERCRPL